MKGLRTIAVGFVMAAAPAGLAYLAGVDWTHYVSPTVAMVISGAVTIGMRLITDTPVGKAE